MERARRRPQRAFRTMVFEISRPVGRIVSIDDRRVLARRNIPGSSLTGGHRTFSRDAKKFSPKHRHGGGGDDGRRDRRRRAWSLGDPKPSSRMAETFMTPPPRCLEAERLPTHTGRCHSCHGRWDARLVHRILPHREEVSFFTHIHHTNYRTPSPDGRNACSESGLSSGRTITRLGRRTRTWHMLNPVAESPDKE